MKRTEKKKLIEKYAVHTKDTGSPQVQVAVLTERISALQDHLGLHPKDNHSRKGLLEMVGKRRKHLNYLRLHNKNTYEELLKTMKLKSPKTTATRKTVKRKVATTKAPAKAAKKVVKKAEKKAVKKAVKKAEKKAVKKAAKKVEKK